MKRCMLVHRSSSCRLQSGHNAAWRRCRRPETEATNTTTSRDQPRGALRIDFIQRNARNGRNERNARIWTALLSLRFGRFVACASCVKEVRKGFALCALRALRVGWRPGLGYSTTSRDQGRVAPMGRVKKARSMTKCFPTDAKHSDPVNLCVASTECTPA